MNPDLNLLTKLNLQKKCPRVDSDAVLLHSRSVRADEPFGFAPKLPGNEEEADPNGPTSSSLWSQGGSNP